MGLSNKNSPIWHLKTMEMKDKNIFYINLLIDRYTANKSGKTAHNLRCIIISNRMYLIYRKIMRISMLIYNDILCEI